MRALPASLIIVAALASAQTPPPTLPPAAAASQPATTQQAAAPQETKPAAPKSDDAASPVPSSEPVFSGWIDFGYRWRTDVAGNFDAYRSIVNLGSGPKLIGTEFTL